MAGIVGVPWWVGVFRWVTLAGAAVCAFAMQAGIASDHDDPTVSHEVGAAGPGAGWAGPLGALGVIVVCSGVVFGVYRNFVG
ncbi:hypothetical protein M8Z33_14265 [Streptomyces sp. ZAF1911]|uniref:hypothetical protein n=1 Tax=Streptomyces sp. ZAF1911 TaxID=2944129 RepID=UPI00237A9327|nr:hypothetical protein [Streptomyces sp. ZAF1911]MDD9377802.1 hypothetical protein [Streptomyces sp. ZAF1911]